MQQQLAAAVDAGVVPLPGCRRRSHGRRRAAASAAVVLPSLFRDHNSLPSWWFSPLLCEAAYILFTIPPRKTRSLASSARETHTTRGSHSSIV